MTRTHDRYREFRDDQREFFDRLVTDDWDSYANPVWDARRRLEVQTLFKHVSPRTVLDVGCGVGFHDLEMAKQPGVEQVIGIDYSEKSVEAAQREYPHPNVDRRTADVFALEPGDYDLAVSFQVIEHLRDAGGFLGACRAQVRDGGWVAVITPNRMRFDNRLARLRRRPLTMIDPQHFKEYTPEELDELAAPHGLEPVALEGFGATFTAPKVGKQVIPHGVGERLGRIAPKRSNVLMRVWRARPA